MFQVTLIFSLELYYFNSTFLLIYCGYLEYLNLLKLLRSVLKVMTGRA